MAWITDSHQIWDISNQMILEINVWLLNFVMKYVNYINLLLFVCACVLVM